MLKNKNQIYGKYFKYKSFMKEIWNKSAKNIYIINTLFLYI